MEAEFSEENRPTARELAAIRCVNSTILTNPFAMKDDELPPSQPDAASVGGIYQLRIGIPDDLKATYPKTKAGTLPTDAFRGSLGTSDRATAIVQAHAKIAEVRQEFEERRASLRAKAVPPMVPLLPRTPGTR